VVGSVREVVTEVADDGTALFEEHRKLLTGVAYRMLGSTAEAEDAVQDAWLRWRQVDKSEVRSPRAYLVQVVTRQALDRLRSAKARHEEYIGSWLPQPAITSPDVAEDAERAESVSMALLVVLETLSPLERAVFVLREVFGLPHTEIAEMLDRTPAAVRQLARRAREHVDERRPRLELDAKVRKQMTDKFMSAWLDGDMQELLRLLSDDATLVADGGGKVRAPRKPIHGAESIARFVVGTIPRIPPDVEIDVVDANGGPAVVARSGAAVVTIVVLDVDPTDGTIRTVYLVANPEKLALTSNPVE
jgi:RNA polymerase sigma-70 factor (ECF subfamily)